MLFLFSCRREIKWWKWFILSSRTLSNPSPRSLSSPRRRVACPQWTAMSQHPASLPTTLPPKCHPTWGTAPPRRPMWPVPRGRRPVAVLYLTTAVTSPALWPSRAWQPTETPFTQSSPRRCEDGRRGEGVRDGQDRTGDTKSVPLRLQNHSHCLPFSIKDSAPGPIFVYVNSQRDSRTSRHAGNKHSQQT